MTLEIISFLFMIMDVVYFLAKVSIFPHPIIIFHIFLFIISCFAQSPFHGSGFDTPSCATKKQLNALKETEASPRNNAGGCLSVFRNFQLLMPARVSMQ